MQQFCPYGSVRGAMRNRRPYREMLADRRNIDRDMIIVSSQRLTPPNRRRPQMGVVPLRLGVERGLNARLPDTKTINRRMG